MAGDRRFPRKPYKEPSEERVIIVYVREAPVPKEGWLRRNAQWIFVGALVPLLVAVIGIYPQVSGKSEQPSSTACRRIDAGDPLRAVYDVDGRSGSRIRVTLEAAGSVGSRGGGKKLVLTGRILVNGKDAIAPDVDERTARTNIANEQLKVSMNHELDVTPIITSIVLRIEEYDPGQNMQVEPRFSCEYVARR